MRAGNPLLVDDLHSALAAALQLPSPFRHNAHCMIWAARHSKGLDIFLLGNKRITLGQCPHEVGDGLEVVNGPVLPRHQLQNLLSRVSLVICLSGLCLSDSRSFGMRLVRMGLGRRCWLHPFRHGDACLSRQSRTRMQGGRVDHSCRVQFAMATKDSVQVVLSTGVVHVAHGQVAVIISAVDVSIEEDQTPA